MVNAEHMSAQKKEMNELAIHWRSKANCNTIYLRRSEMKYRFEHEQQKSSYKINSINVLHHRFACNFMEIEEHNREEKPPTRLNK